jgi:superfamily II DNA or RNA helicase
MQLRDYQAKAIQDLRDAYRDRSKAPLLVLPTGGGKTVIFSYAAQQAVARGSKVLILVHRKELIEQTSEALTRLGLLFGIIAAKHKQSDALVQIASVATLVKRLSNTKWRPDLIIIDEAHHAVAGSWQKILDCYNKARLLGVTATPKRLDGRGLKSYFDSLVLGPSVKSLTEQGYLSPVKCYTVPRSIDRKTLLTTHSIGGDYAPNEAAQKLEEFGTNGEAVKEYSKHCPGKPAIAFCCNIQHSELMAKRFRDAGFRAAHLHSKTSPHARKGLIEYLGNGELDVLTSCNIVNEGTDIPVVTAAILLRPTKSEALYLQQVGRVLRPAPGKDHALILDCVGNVLTHGLPGQDREWSLEDKKKNAPACKECPNCYAVISSLLQVCPECGHEFIVEQAKESDKKKPLIVDLVEFKEIFAKADKVKLIAEARTYQDFKAVAKRLGYKPGWAYHKHREKLGLKNAYNLSEDGRLSLLSDFF